MFTESTLNPLYSLDGAAGSNPTSGLIQASDGTFYGTTSADVAHNDGTVFEISSSAERVNGCETHLFTSLTSKLG
jgi:uncharacterized repeat protein (TIGR03803 family)